MVELTSIAWKNFRVPEGSATEVPAKIVAFKSAPSLDKFDDLWDTLTGIGDIQITNAFWPAVLHILDSVLNLPQADRELAIGQIGWGIALASSKRSASKDASQKRAKDQIAKAALECLRSSKDQTNKRYLLAAIAACCSLPDIALSIIHNE